jgi:hypothetical protein
MYNISYYKPTIHFRKRYKERMSQNVKNKTASRRLLEASEAELAKRANYMLLFSIHGRPGETEHTEVRYYFNWNIVIDNRDKTLITMYIDEEREVPPVRLFGDRKLRKMIYDLWFKPKSRVSQTTQQTNKMGFMTSGKTYSQM